MLHNCSLISTVCSCMNKLYQENEEPKDSRESTEATKYSGEDIIGLFTAAQKIGRHPLKDRLLSQNRIRDT